MSATVSNLRLQYSPLSSCLNARVHLSFFDLPSFLDLGVILRILRHFGWGISKKSHPKGNLPMSANIIDQNIPVWHALPAQEVLARLHSEARSGLPAVEVSRRLERYGRNQLPQGRKKGPL